MADISASNVCAGPNTLGLWDRLFTKESLLATAIFVAVPNLFFLVFAPWFMLRRAFAPIFYVIAGVMSLVTPRPLAYLWFVLAAAGDVFLTVSLAFGMPFALTLRSMRFIKDIDLTASVTYIACGLAVLASALACAYLTNRLRPQLRKASPVLAAIGGIALFCGDLALNGYPPAAPDQIDGAFHQTGHTSDKIVANDRNVLFVLVEGMGAYANIAERDLLESKLRSAAGDKFRLTHGTNQHFGSTSGAMSRELCGRWGTFIDYLDGKQHDCLPARLAQAGFETISYDAFESDLFALHDWYPRIGLQRSNFRRDMERDHPSVASRLCGTTLRGLCDDDVGELVHQEMATPSIKRKFVY